MKPIERETAPSGLGLNDILFMLFRHKWKLLLCTLLGLAAAASVYLLTPRDYESRAKLLVRYVLERSSVDEVDPHVKTSGAQTDAAIINSEVEILTSSDLAVQVAETVGVERLAPQLKGADARAAAITTVMNGLIVGARKGSNVIAVAYRNRDPELARSVLDELVKKYFDKHLEVHRSGGAFEFVSQQTLEVRNRLTKTEDALKKLKADAGILSLVDSTASINLRMAKSEEELLAAQAQFAEQQARLKEMEKQLGGSSAVQTKASGDDAETSATPVPSFRNARGIPQPTTGAEEMETAPASVDSREIERYQLLLERVAQSRKGELELLARYTAESQPVKSARIQIEDLDRQRRDLEKKFPALLAVAPKTASSHAPQQDIASERAGLAAIAARVETLKAQLNAAEEHATRLAQVGPEIAQLERKKEVEEANFKYFDSSLEKARVDEALDPSKMPNISVVQKPSTGAKVAGNTVKLALGLAGGGIALGIGLALLIELLVNRSVKRPLELETRLRVPQLLSIPYFSSHSRSRLRLNNAAGQSCKTSNGALKKVARPGVAPWAPDHFIRTFSEEIRDRLILSFQLKNLTHKPKLVGIAGLSGGEGASTLAGGLAAALSETGDGKVLLVDMNSGNPETHSFSEGKPACGLAEALQANGDLPPTAGNLYLATGSSGNGGSMLLAAKRFYALVPNLKESHFDYIIFDMPPVTQGSATLAIAGCLDKLLFVVEAEKSNRDEVKRAYADLVAAKADVSGILNKTRSSGPSWLNG